jgi:hypothetical protein
MIGADRHPAGVRGDVVDAVRLAHVIRYLDDAYAIDPDAHASAIRCNRATVESPRAARTTVATGPSR